MFNVTAVVVGAFCGVVGLGCGVWLLATGTPVVKVVGVAFLIINCVSLHRLVKAAR